MNKIKILFFGLILIFSTNSSNAQVVKKGDIIIDAYYGFPNLYKVVFTELINFSGNELNLAVNSNGPFGFRGEYMFAERFGLGLDFGYSNVKVTYQKQNENQIYDYDFKTRKIGIMATFNYHFLQSTDKLDAYAVIGAGFKNRNYGYDTNDPNFFGVKYGLSFPFAFKIGAGARYFLTQNLGVNLALQAGQGGIINLGVSVKL